MLSLPWDARSCDSSPCQNGATCINHLGFYTCTCSKGWTGKNCETGNIIRAVTSELERTFGHVRPAKSPISLHICAVGSESSLGIFCITKGAKVLRADNRDSHQTLWMQSLIWVITKTYLYNFDPLKLHFYIVKLRFTGVYTIFRISAKKH